MKKADVEEMFRVLSAINPEPKTELEYESPYTLLVAVALSAQSTDVGVNKATKSLFAVANTPEKMVSLGVEGVKEHIRTLGLFNNKAKNVVALSQILLDQYDGDVPQDRDVLETLPGVG
ncbi:MAG: endonuclease III, partial [Pseudomonadota bacterium]